MVTWAAIASDSEKGLQGGYSNCMRIEEPSDLAVSEKGAVLGRKIWVRCLLFQELLGLILTVLIG
jgi:hypothetical protein